MSDTDNQTDYQNTRAQLVERVDSHRKQLEESTKELAEFDKMFGSKLVESTATTAPAPRRVAVSTADRPHMISRNRKPTNGQIKIEEAMAVVMTEHANANPQTPAVRAANVHAALVAKGWEFNTKDLLSYVRFTLSNRKDIFVPDQTQKRGWYTVDPSYKVPPAPKAVAKPVVPAAEVQATADILTEVPTAELLIETANINNESGENLLVTKA